MLITHTRSHLHTHARTIYIYIYIYTSSYTCIHTDRTSPRPPPPVHNVGGVLLEERQTRGEDMEAGAHAKHTPQHCDRGGGGGIYMSVFIYNYICLYGRDTYTRTQPHAHAQTSNTGSAMSFFRWLLVCSSHTRAPTCTHTHPREHTYAQRYVQ